MMHKKCHLGFRSNYYPVRNLVIHKSVVCNMYNKKLFDEDYPIIRKVNPVYFMTGKYCQMIFAITYDEEYWKINEYENA